MWMQSLLGARAPLWARLAQDKFARQHQVSACQVEALSRHGALLATTGNQQWLLWQLKFAQDVVLAL